MQPIIGPALVINEAVGGISNVILVARVVNWESVVPVSSSQDVPYEGIVGVPLTVAGAYEALGRVVASGSANWESIGELNVVTNSQDIAWEALSPSVMITFAPWEAMKGVFPSLDINWEAIGFVTTTQDLWWESLGVGLA